MPQDSLEPRQLVALNADVVGYSRLMADDLETTSSRVDEYRDLVEQAISQTGGTLVNFVGDNFMAVFTDAKDAVRTAIAITADIESRNTDVPPQQRVRFRMGLDVGDVTHSEHDYRGDALNIAARIQAIAPEGGVAVSGRVYRALDEPALRFRPVGPQRLKNIPERVEVYEFVDLPGDGSATDRRGLSLEAPSVAVLPIHTEGVDDAVRNAAAVIRLDLIHRLAAVPDVKVVDATTEPGGGHPQSSARYMLETGVHQFGDQVRVYATLFDVSTVNVVKSHKWTAPAADMFELSDRIAEEVGRAVEVDLVVGEPAGLYAELDDPEAIEKVYLGWYHLRTDTPEGWARSLELFRDVSRSHPDHTYGSVLLAFSYWMGAASGWAPDTAAALDKAQHYAQIGLEIGDQTGLATAVTAAVQMSQGRIDEALATMDRLEIIRPTCDVTYGLEGSLRRYLGQWEKAVDLLDVAMRLTGINKPWYPTVKACSLFVGGRLEQAASLAESVLEYQPHNLEALLVLAAAQSELGLQRRAEATAELIKERFPEADVRGWLDRSPFESGALVERWKEDLVAAGALETK